MQSFYSTLRMSLFILTTLLVAFSAGAQTRVNGSVTGKILDAKSGLPVEYSVASLLNAADSSVADNAVTDQSGQFAFYRVKKGEYVLKVNVMGYKTLRRKLSVTAALSKIALGNLEVETAPIRLNEVAVKSAPPAVVVKPDTLEFNAGSFKTRENALTEDLLKKLPGVQVDKDGNITAQGESVKRIFVDGREFFGSDPKIATRNLPANIIDKVQVIDKKSDQAEFTKIDDGVREKVINLTVKADKKIGLFGNASLGDGTDDLFPTGDNRFDGNLSVNRFNNKQQVSMIVNGNNTNKSNFSLQNLGDLSGNSMMGGMFSGGSGTGGGTRMVIGGSGGGGLSGGSGLDNLSPAGAGITTAGSGGLNFRDSWGKETDLNGSYFYNYSNAENEILDNRTSQFSTGNAYYTTQTGIGNTRKNNRVNLDLDYRIDSLNSIKLTPSLSFNINNQDQGATFESLNNTLAKVNDGSSHNHTGFTSPSLNNNVLFKHSFLKRGRTLSVNLASAVNSSATAAYNQSNTQYYASPIPQEKIDQYLDQDASVNNQTLRASYTEPLSRQNYLELNYSFTDNYSKANRQTFNFDSSTSLYDLVDPSLSNIYTNTFIANQYGFNLRTVKRKLNYTLGMGFQQTHLKGEATNLPSGIDRNFYSFLPNANMSYQYTQNKRLALNYRTSVRQPSITQLQPVPDNSNPLNIKNGNPGLKPEYNNNVVLNYSNYSIFSGKSIFGNISVQQISNRIASKVDLDPATGKRVSTPLNVSGNWMAFGNLALGVPVRPLKTSFNLNTGLTTRRDVNFSNSDRNITQALSLSQGISWSYSAKDTYDFYVNLTGTYNHTGYSLKNLAALNYYDYRASTDFNYNFPSGFKAGFDIEYTANTGRGKGYNQSVFLLGTSAQKDVMTKRATVKLTVNDVFNQNLNVTRNVTENSVEDIRSNNIRRYFLLGFSYRFNKFSGAAPVGTKSARG